MAALPFPTILLRPDSLLAMACLLLAGLALRFWRLRRQLAARVIQLDQQHELLSEQIWDLRAAAEDRNRAEAASEAKSRFLATVSHEIRTPLNGILGIADLLKQTPLTREQQAYVAAVTTSGTALTSLIDEILDFARIESGRLDLDPEPFDLTELVEGVVELLGPQAQDKGLEIAAFVDHDLATRVVGDAQRLRQVLLNLAGNAVKFTDAGGVGVRVDRTSGGALRFSVSDTGPGVPEERRAAIFEEFEQADGSTTRRHGGTGLGLAIAKRIILRMGGDLDLEDRDGGGSVFTFTVPLPPAPGSRSEGPARAGLRPCRALVVSAGPFQPAYLAEALHGLQGTVVRAGDVDEALARLRHDASGFDLMFVDCGIGEQEARMLARAARAAHVARSILLFSPFERRAFGNHVLGGFDAWLVKPVRRASLVEQIRPASGATAGVLTGPEHRSRPTGLRVLLAEDNPINALIARTSLERLGVEVTHAANGNAALAAAEMALTPDHAGFDLILMDVCMPGLDGLDVTRRIRAAEARCGMATTRIVAMTAHTFDQTLRDCRSAGMDEILTKPVEATEFSRLVREQSRLSRAG